MFSGSIVAIVTPFRNGKLDERAFGDLIEWQIANGTNGIVPCGTTGESATLTHDEHHRVVRLTVEVAKGRVPGPAPIVLTRPSPSLDMPKMPAQMGRCSSRPITTNRRRRDCIAITRPLPKPSICL
jgi:4-hydroxy-tetrahydrodipicolinate synthase